MFTSKSLLKIFLPVILLTLFNQCSYSQKTDSADLVSVTLNIIAEGRTKYYSENSTGFFALATVKNIQDTSVYFWVMTCSWPDVNWTTNNNSIFFGSHGCDNNFPERIELSPNQSISFNLVFTRIGNKSLNKKVKLGFIYYNSFNEIFEAAADRNKLKEYKKFWSNEVLLEDRLFTFKKEE